MMITLAALALIAGSASATLIVDIQFDDAVGTTLSGVANAGTDVASFAADLDSGATDGAGNWHADGSVASILTKNLNMADISTGIVTLNFGVSALQLANSADVSGVSVQLDTLSGSDWKFKIEKRAGFISFVSVNPEATARNTDSTISTDGSAGPIDMEATFNLDTGAWSSGYTYDSVYTELNSGLANTWGALTVLKFGGDNNPTFAAGDYIDTDYITLDHVIPEPATIGMLGLGAVATLLISRFKRA